MKEAGYEMKSGERIRNQLRVLNQITEIGKTSSYIFCLLISRNELVSQGWPSGHRHRRTRPFTASEWRLKKYKRQGFSYRKVL